MNKEFSIQNLKDPLRVDLYLISQLPELTRSSAKKVIMEGILTVDNQKVKPNFRVCNGQIVEVDLKRVEVLLEKDQFAKLQPAKLPLNIIYEDENLIVLNKRSGDVVHPVTGHTNDTLMNGLLYREIQNSKNKSEVNRIRPIHRLDKDTSGVILFSKTKQAHGYYSKSFENREVEKTYFAIVSGDFKEYISSKTSKDYFEIFTYIARSTTERKRFLNTSIEKGLPARTKVYFEKYWIHPVKKNKVYSLLKLIPETGRTHQLRVHLSGIQFPILGDLLYEGENYSRLMLHAYSLKINLYPHKEEKIFIANMPNEFNT